MNPERPWTWRYPPLPSEADIQADLQHVCFVPILLKKAFLGDERNFLEPLMRFARVDVRTTSFPQKNDHGPLYRRHGALQRLDVKKSTFARISMSFDFRLFNSICQQATSRVHSSGQFSE
jgi:hypothetical protein